MNQRTTAALIGCLALLVGHHCDGGFERPPGILAARDPIQSAIASPTQWQHKGFVFTNVASYDIEARVLHRRDYPLRWTHHLGFFHQDFEQFSPLDLALGWGVMSDSAWIDRLEIWQEGRFYVYRPKRGADLSLAEVGLHSANVHMVPASDAIESRLRSVRRGDLVRLEGDLVNVTHPETGWRLRTSLTRTDHACEVLYVRRFELLD